MQALVFSGASPTGPIRSSRAMNRVGYDAMAVGNHEFDFGRARLETSRREARFPWLSANIVGEDGKPAFAPYIVATDRRRARRDSRPDDARTCPSWEPPAHIAGLRFSTRSRRRERYVPILRGKEKCDVVLVITHQGFERDLADGRGPAARAEREPGLRDRDRGRRESTSS